MEGWGIVGQKTAQENFPELGRFIQETKGHSGWGIKGNNGQRGIKREAEQGQVIQICAGSRGILLEEQWEVMKSINQGSDKTRFMF